MHRPPADASVDVKDWIDSRPVSAYQWLILSMCFLIVLFDGFDVAVMGFIAPSLMKDWKLSRAAFGPVMSAGMLGLAFGALTAGPYADRLGRKNVLLIAVSGFSGTLSTRSFIPHRCHASIGVFGAVSVATACLLEGTVAQGIAVVGSGDQQRLSVEHPSAELSIEVRLQHGAVVGCGLIRTARLLFDGQVCIPGHGHLHHPDAEAD